LNKPVFLISAVNLNEGGPLSILKDAANNFVEYFISDYKLVLLVHNKNLLDNICLNQSVEVYEYAYPKKSWFLRLWFEYVHCYFISKKIKPYLWFALHDITPNVECTNKILYYHNPAPFYKLSIREAWIEKSLIFFNLFYSLFYRINIHTNKYVIVQQQWIREEFEQRYNLKNVIVSYPNAWINEKINMNVSAINNKFCFFYPSLPRVFKNFEVLLEAAATLEKLHYDFEVVLTFDGSENKYASKLVKKYSYLSCIKFVGIQKREELSALYNYASCLVFASKLETWGLPITEMKLFNKPMLLADSKYAHETVGNYHKACFFEPDDPVQLGELMKKAIKGTLEFHTSEFMSPQPPFTKTWKELFSLILT
jgi:glycosyltransferase involved in cell wall biosynthesis